VDIFPENYEVVLKCMTWWFLLFRYVVCWEDFWTHITNVESKNLMCSHFEKKNTTLILCKEVSFVTQQG